MVSRLDRSDQPGFKHLLPRLFTVLSYCSGRSRRRFRTPPAFPSQSLFGPIFQMHRSHFWFAVAAPVVLLISFAIRLSGSSDAAASKVSGFVFLDDAPLTNADIFLVREGSDDSSQSYFGQSNDGGHYSIMNSVPPGTYRVVVKRLMSSVQDASEPHQAVDDIDPGQMQVMLAARQDRERRSTSRSYRSASRS